MKRKALILLTAVYLFSVLGVSAKSMYCMGILRSTQVSYGTGKPKKADCKMAVRMKRCCQTKKQLLKVNDQHFHSVTMEILAKLFPVLFNFTGDDAPTCAVTNQQQQLLHYSHAPPSAVQPPAYMLNCNYRI